ncbi:MAG: hypothetical protein CMB96_01800 [Flavobacteriaceae bacterium]|nr:hypothetical protein [Flavobacteriaceae bacterium]
MFCVFLVLFNCKEGKRFLTTESEFQTSLNALFKDASRSPLKPEDIKTFKGLSFFPIDSSFVVISKLKRTNNSDFFQMKTSTTRLSKERVFGILSFTIKGLNYNLKVYQSESSVLESSDYLLLPYLDATNGITTYGGGRYLDLKIPEGDSIWLDFNKSYNPYCVYNERYSCPIVPRENHLPIKVDAGVMYNYKN